MEEVVVAVHKVVADPELDLLTTLVPHPDDVLVEEVYGGVKRTGL